MGYVSKDFVHMGCGMDLLPEDQNPRPPIKIRCYINNIDEAGDIIIRKVEGSESDFAILKSMWYDPDDPNLPYYLPEGGHMFIAYRHEEPLGVCLVLEVGNHLFLNNLASNAEGKKIHLSDYLLWHIQKEFGASQFKYLDIGVSYRPSLYSFFKKWATRHYPVIFNPPDMPVRIGLKPFSTENYQLEYQNKEKAAFKELKRLTGIDKLTFAPAVEWAEKILEKDNINYSLNTFNFPELSNPGVEIIDLTEIFPVQFGALIKNYEVSDEDMWNRHGCLDLFKRRLVMSLIYNDITNIEAIIQARKDNYIYLAELFDYEGISHEKRNEKIPSRFYFKNELNERYHKKLEEFSVGHYYENGTIGLPVHQNMTKAHLDYLYGIFHGVLNLCSEWEHTDKYSGYKGQ